MPIQILVVDDHEPWRRFICATLRQRPEFHLHEATDGLEAVRQSQALQPDLILLDINLPKLNGLEAASEIEKLAPHAKIIFVSEDRSHEIAQEALGKGAKGFVIKSDSWNELLPAVDAVLRGDRFLSANHAASLLGSAVQRDRGSGEWQAIPGLVTRNLGSSHRHDVAFYPNDGAFVEGFARFIGFALKRGEAVIAVVNDSHRNGIFQKLRANAVDLDGARSSGNLTVLRVTAVVPLLMQDGIPDRRCCTTFVRDLITGVRNTLADKSVRVATCGEIAPTLLAEGDAEGATNLEHLWDEITRTLGASTLCGYLWHLFSKPQDKSVFERICIGHSAVISY